MDYLSSAHLTCHFQELVKPVIISTIVVAITGSSGAIAIKREYVVGPDGAIVAIVTAVNYGSTGRLGR